MCRTEGVLKFYSFARPPERYSFQLLQMLSILKLHGYVLLFTDFFLLSQPYVKDIA